MSDSENKNIGGKTGNSNEVNVDKESAFLRELLFGDDSPAQSDADIVSNSENGGESANAHSIGNDGAAHSGDNTVEPETAEVLGGFSDFITDSGEPKEEKVPENEFSSRFQTENYNTEDMPHFFTESSEYDDEQPLDVSDFYPPVKSDDIDNQADNAGSFADSSVDVSNQSDSAADDGVDDVTRIISELSEISEPTGVFEPVRENEPTALDYDGDDGDDDNEPLADGYFVDAVDSAEADSEVTRVFNAISDDISEKTGTNDSKPEQTKSAPTATRAGGRRTAEKKPNIFIRFLSGLLPWKGDPKKEVARKLVLIAAYITIIAMGWQIISYYVLDPIHNNNLVDQLHSMYVPKDDDYSSPEMNPKFSALYDLNNDVVGWIKVRDTNIDYPVIKGDTNSEYERRDIYHNYTRYGSIFMEASSSIAYGAESRNIVIYGHNMKDDSSMFSQLTHYRDFDFYKNHATFIFDSLYNDGTWKIFSIMTTNAYPAQDDGRYFDFRKSSFVDDAEFNSWIEGCRIRSCINTGVDVLPTDTVLTLQTCVYEFSDARLVIMARRARPGESKDVDVTRAVVNPNPRYPQAWYDAKGTVNPYADGKIPEDANYLPNADAASSNGSYAFVLDNTAGVTVVTTQGSTAAAVSSAAVSQPQPTVRAGNAANNSAVRRTTVRTPQQTAKKPQTTAKKTSSATKKPQATTKKQPVTAAPTKATTKAPTKAPTKPVTQAPTEDYEPNAPY